MTGLATARYVLAKRNIMANTYIEEDQENFLRVFSCYQKDGSIMKELLIELRRRLGCLFILIC